jgi:hypothetical protein
MSELEEIYDRALHAPSVPSVEGALRLRAVVLAGLREGKSSRSGIYTALQTLMSQYLEEGRSDDAEAVAQVLDAFDGWSPNAARL